MLSKEEIEKAKRICKLLCGKKNKKGKREYKIFSRLQLQADYTIDELAEQIETLLQYIAQLEQENKNLKMVLDNGLDKNKKYCFNEDGNTGKCLGYSNINDDEPCEYCKSCEVINVKGED